MMSKSLWIIIAALLAVNVCLHAFVSGWGNRASGSLASGPVPYGIVYSEPDNLSYSSWAQQARQGHYLFSDLHTTAPHRPLLFNFFFCVTGSLARVFSTSPILIFNIAGLLCIPLFVFAMHRLATALGFNSSTSLMVICLALGGGGISWIRLLLQHVGLQAPLWPGGAGPDLLYYDLYPASAFSIYPFHTFSLTVITILCLLVVTGESAANAFKFRNALLLFIVAAILAGTRPYEPVMLLGVYAFLTCLSHICPCSAQARQRRRQILLSLAAGMLPFIAYSVWISRQPVWNSFANASVNMFGNLDWFGGFLVLWALVIPVFFALTRNLFDQPMAFFLTWTGGCFLLLLVFASGFTKLCGGITIPLSLVAGITVNQLLTSHPRWKNTLSLLLIFSAFASTVLVHWLLFKHPQRAQGDLLQACSAIQSGSPSPAPVILTDPETGIALPGLAGFRVYCGHWCLTGNYKEKTALLYNMGFCGNRDAMKLAASEIPAIEQQNLDLANQIHSHVFDYLLLQKNHALCADLLSEGVEHPVYDGPEVLVLKMSPSLAGRLEAKLRASTSVAPGNGRQGLPALELGAPPISKTSHQ